MDLRALCEHTQNCFLVLSLLFGARMIVTCSAALQEEMGNLNGSHMINQQGAGTTKHDAVSSLRKLTPKAMLLASIFYGDFRQKCVQLVIAAYAPPIAGGHGYQNKFQRSVQHNLDYELWNLKVGWCQVIKDCLMLWSDVDVLRKVGLTCDDPSGALLRDLGSVEHPTVQHWRHIALLFGRFAVIFAKHRLRFVALLCVCIVL